MDDSDRSFDLPEAWEVPERSFLRSEVRPEDDFADAVLKGFARRPRSLPCRFFYDARGSELFEAITKLGFTITVRNPEEFRPYHAREMQTWAEIIKAANIQPAG